MLVAVMCGNEVRVDKVSDMDEITEIHEIMATCHCKCAGEAITSYVCSRTKADSSVLNKENRWKI